MPERHRWGGVYPRGKASWRIVVSTGRDAITGKYTTVRETIRGSKREAIRRRNELATEVARGTVARDERESVASFLSRFLNHRERLGNIRPKTAAVYRGYVRREVTPCIGNLRLADVRPVHVQRVLDEALARGLAARSVLQVHRILHAAFRQAVRWQLIAVNPSDGATPPKTARPELSIPSAADIARLLREADENYRVALALLAATGMRRGEVAALRWRCVHLEAARPLLSVEGSLQRVNGRLQVVPPKTERGYRTVPLPASVVALLRRHRAEQSERRLIAGAAWHDTDIVFDRADGRPLDPDELTKAFQRARARAGLDAIRLHDLRHAWATLQMTAGTHPRVVSDILGHARVSFTLDVYSHPDMALAQSAAETVEAALGEALIG